MASIVIVEDEKFLLEICERKFRTLGFTVKTAVDGPSGLEKITSSQPDIVLLDIILPNMDGFEVLRRVRSDPDPQIAKIPIIILSNLGQDSDIEKAKRLGANDYLVKTFFTVEEIVAKVKELLGPRI